MMALPPGDPTNMTGLPSRNTMIGAIELRGRLPGSTRLATSLPSGSLNDEEKSVISLFNKKPRTKILLPNSLSMVVVMDSALPCLSTATRWLVDGSSSALSRPSVSSLPSGSPGSATFMLRSGWINAPRARR
ncbi:hypothetical protein D3C73_1145750 [compost metagenome]